MYINLCLQISQINTNTHPHLYVIGRIILPQRSSNPNPQTLCICYITWQKDFFTNVPKGMDLEMEKSYWII